MDGPAQRRQAHPAADMTALIELLILVTLWAVAHIMDP